MSNFLKLCLQYCQKIICLARTNLRFAEKNRLNENIGCTHALLIANMLKETENEETRLFCHIFIIGGISFGGGKWAMPPGPFGYAYDCNLMLFVILRFLMLFCLLFALVCMSKWHK